MSQRMAKSKALESLPPGARSGYEEMRSQVQMARFALELALNRLFRTPWPESDQCSAWIEYGRSWIEDQKAKGKINKATLVAAEARLKERFSMLEKMEAAEQVPGSKEEKIRREFDEAYADFTLKHAAYMRLLRTCRSEGWPPEIEEETPEEAEERERLLAEEDAKARMEQAHG